MGYSTLVVALLAVCQVYASATGNGSISLGWSHSLFLFPSGVVKAAGYNNYGQLMDGSTVTASSPAETLSGASNITSIACGYTHSLALLSDGTVLAAGENSGGKLG